MSEKKSYSALEIANFYVQLLNSLPDNSIDNLKLNKILYYAQGWSMVRLNRPLFSDKIVAWDYGPVIPSVYHTFKCCGSNPIEEPTEYFDENRLASEELDLLIDVYSNYGRYTGWALKDMTHKKGTPWDNVYKRGENKEITTDDMKSYFSSQKLDTFDIAKVDIPVMEAVPVSWDSNEDSVYDEV